ncbi:uncharacterized protein SPSK_06734 [Sporothrix schenckii 1099-18]|uniref:Uncharacterized protein n=1 Tax=Sporothrix schenckii 1099-18 TaxID=1397361 RepID=A0A0F2MKB3_SPOSC|nr:uncharacterized protein SPSK_06734 [Sporothrix schenckii 1099-18]KJR89280.1 hypothetical protein SPSK_06734 [Sporothrix schenckii 1099-18]
MDGTADEDGQGEQDDQDDTPALLTAPPVPVTSGIPDGFDAPEVHTPRKVRRNRIVVDGLDYRGLSFLAFDATNAVLIDKFKARKDPTLGMNQTVKIRYTGSGGALRFMYEHTQQEALTIPRGPSSLLRTVQI